MTDRTTGKTDQDGLSLKSTTGSSESEANALPIELLPFNAEHFIFNNAVKCIVEGKRGRRRMGFLENVKDAGARLRRMKG